MSLRHFITLNNSNNEIFTKRKEIICIILQKNLINSFYQFDELAGRAAPDIYSMPSVAND